jgi:hypothetical protein
MASVAPRSSTRVRIDEPGVSASRYKHSVSKKHRCLVEREAVWLVFADANATVADLVVVRYAGEELLGVVVG